MIEALRVFAPLFAFMLIPVWIPLIGAAVGRVYDVFRPREEHPVLVARQIRHAQTRAVRQRTSAPSFEAALDAA